MLNGGLEMNFATGEYGNYLLIDMVKDLYE